MFAKVVRFGMIDRDESVRNAAQTTLLELTPQCYRPFRSTIDRGCGMRSNESTFRDLLVTEVSDLIREQARRRPKLLLEAFQAKLEGFDSMFLALAETKSPSVRATMVERASQGHMVGLEALINWPVHEGLDVVISRFRSGIPEDEETYETALLVYGERGLRKLAPIWSSLPESSRSLVYVAMKSLPCKAALDLLEKDARDKRPEIRGEAASLLGGMIVKEWCKWNEWFAGPNPQNLDSNRGIRLLRTLARDADQNVREVALDFLDQE